MVEVRAGESASSWHQRWEPSKGPVSQSIAVYAKLESNSEPERARVSQRVAVRASGSQNESHREPERDRERASKSQREKWLKVRWEPTPHFVPLCHWPMMTNWPTHPIQSHSTFCSTMPQKAQYDSRNTRTTSDKLRRTKTVNLQWTQMDKGARRGKGGHSWARGGGRSSQLLIYSRWSMICRPKIIVWSPVLHSSLDDLVWSRKNHADVEHGCKKYDWCIFRFAKAKVYNPHVRDL